LKIAIETLACRMGVATKAVKDLEDGEFDAVVVVAPSTKGLPSVLKTALAPLLALDAGAETKGCTLVPVPLPAKRLIYSPTGPVDRDYDDLRRFSEAAVAGIKRAVGAGARAPLLLVKGSLPGGAEKDACMAGLLGALSAVYVPLEMRESVKERATKVDRLGWFGEAELLKFATQIEDGLIVGRDIGGSDPERMAPPNVEKYVREVFKGTNITIEVEKGQAHLEAEYPCMAAVNRAASLIERHDARLIWLTYKPQGPVKKTVYLVGKGISYDTGGADIKAGGVMAGMSRDKCGAAAVAGVMKTLSLIKPEGICVVGALCMVRNSVGENCYVSDEIITSRAGIRIRIGNTDAEGRMAMVDVLCKCKEAAVKQPNPSLFTIATLTGHACIAVGDYSIVMDNGPARQAGVAQQLLAAGDKMADLFEISTIRREDWDFNADKSGEFVAILQANSAPSTRTPRGHQIPSAFLQQVSGLDQHQVKHEIPLKYSHIDIAAAAGELPHPTTGRPVAALVKYILE
jgi:leucyl aminopeptidase